VEGKLASKVADKWACLADHDGEGSPDELCPRTQFFDNDRLRDDAS